MAHFCSCGCVCGAKDKLGCENMCATVLKAQATMGEANLTCLEVCQWRISLCLDVQKFSKDVTVPGESAGTLCARWSVLWQKTQFALWGMKTNSPKKWRQPHPKRGRPNKKIAEYLAKKGRQPYPKTGSPLRWPAGLSRENMQDYGYIHTWICSFTVRYPRNPGAGIGRLKCALSSEALNS